MFMFQKPCKLHFALIIVFLLNSPLLLSAPLLQRAKPEESNQLNAGVELNRAEIGRVRYELQQQIEILQQEVQVLRGLIEEQNHTIEQMRKGERERYTDLDTRIRSLQGKTPASVNAPVSSVNSTINSLADEEESTYQSAKKKVDDKEYNAAIAEFMLYLEFFPEGRFVPQSHYWLGELYMGLEIPEYDNAKKHFEKVINDFPEHAKVPGCLYKLGLIYKVQGKPVEARKQLEKLVKQFPDSSTASLAKSQLESL